MAMITERAIEREDARRDFQELIYNNQQDQRFGNFKILDADTDEFIGLAKLEVRNPKRFQAELGYMILPQFWGKGLASQAATLLLAKAQRENGLKRVYAIIDPRNLPSKKILIKHGFVSKAFKDFDGLPGEVLERLLSE